MTGQTISHYRIVEKLGEGGMGVVYKAEDLKLGRAVALKFLPSHLIESEEHKTRFLHEARAAALLDHPNICTVYEIDEANGQTFLAMACLAGQTLKQKIATRPLPLQEALDIALQIGQGLQAAHEKGIVHRDIKPANIMITPQGQVKIMDFGLAQLSDRTKLTASGMKLGTPAYMSPEQTEGKLADRRSDIWALGVVLYEMVSGRVPFPGEAEAALAYAIVHTEPEPLSALRTGVPLELDRIVGKALAKNPAERYQHIEDLLVDLRAPRGNLGTVRATGTRATARPSWRRWVWATLLPVLVVAAYFAREATRAPKSTEPLRAVPLTTQPGVHRYPSFSPDGSYVAFTWNGPKQDNPDIYVQVIGSGSPLRLTTDPSNDYNAAWSPDGRWIAFLRRQSEPGTSELRLIPPLGGPERKLAEVRPRWDLLRPVSLAWCPDSNCLVVTDSPGQGKPDALFVVALETGEKRQLTSPQLPAWGDVNPAVSPDGRWLVFRRQFGGLAAGELYRLSLGTGLTAASEPLRLAPAALDANFPTWMPDSREILFSARGSLWRLGVQGESTPARLPFVGEDGLMPAISRPQPGWRPRLVYVRSFRDTNIWRVETSAPGATAFSPPVVSIASTRWDTMPQLFPDGRRVAFVSSRSGYPEIWLADPDGSNALQLTFMSAPVTTRPDWSPDGRLIVFHSNLEGQPEVYMIPAAGGKPRNLTSHPAADSLPSFSRDGQWIYFNSNRTGEFRIWKIPVSAGDAVQVTNSLGHAPVESPDGAHLYYVQTRDRPGPLWRMPTSGGVPVKVLERVDPANFAVLQGGIYYIDRPSSEGDIHFSDLPSGETRLHYLDFATRRSTTVARNLGNIDSLLTASADGRMILYSRTDSSVDDLMLVENFR